MVRVGHLLCTGMQLSEGDTSERFGDLSFRSMSQIFSLPQRAKKVKEGPLSGSAVLLSPLGTKMLAAI